jgi:hypothetical protein
MQRQRRTKSRAGTLESSTRRGLGCGLGIYKVVYLSPIPPVKPVSHCQKSEWKQKRRWKWVKLNCLTKAGSHPWYAFESATASLKAAMKREDELLTKGADFPWEFAGLIGAVDTLLVELRDSGAAPCLNTLYPPHN